ncbi:unnamed protein product, partial [marine sediment metagenome]
MNRRKSKTNKSPAGRVGRVERDLARLERDTTLALAEILAILNAMRENVVTQRLLLVNERYETIALLGGDPGGGKLVLQG